MKRIMVLLIAMFFAIIVKAENENQLFKGSWDFNAKHAPYGYEEGEITFVTKNNKLSAIVNINSIDIKTGVITRKKDFYYCIFFVDNTLVEVKLKVKNNTLTGIAKVDYSEIEISFEREKNNL